MQAAPEAQARRKKRSKLDRGWHGYLFIAPFFVVFLIFGLYPIISTFQLSLQKWDGMMPAIQIGLKNYARILGDQVFYLSLWNTIRIWVGNAIPQFGMALVLAAIFTFFRVRGKNFYRAVFYLPNLITATSVGLLFNLMLEGDNSPINQLLVALGVNGAPISFFMSKTLTSGLVSFVQWWMWFGYTTVIILAGTTTVDKSLYEAAMVDGASKSQTFWKITIPLIQPTLVYLAITSFIGGMQLFDVPLTLTNNLGDPGKAVLTVSMYLYNQGFKNFNYGYSATISCVLFLLIAVMSGFAYKAMRRKDGMYKL